MGRAVFSSDIAQFHPCRQGCKRGRSTLAQSAIQRIVWGLSSRRVRDSEGVGSQVDSECKQNISCICRTGGLVDYKGNGVVLDTQR